MSKIAIDKIPKCVFPNCNRRRAAMFRRGKNSPLYDIDQSRRWAYCRYHQKGKGKPERLEQVRGMR